MGSAESDDALSYGQVSTEHSERVVFEYFNNLLA